MRWRISVAYLILLGLGVLLPHRGLPAQEDENGVSVLTEPYYSKEQVEKPPPRSRPSGSGHRTTAGRTCPGQPGSRVREYAR